MEPCFLRLCLCTFVLPVFVRCHQPAATTAPALLSYFQALPPNDTLQVEITTDPDVPVAGDTIPNALFFKVMPSALLQEIDYLADSAQAVVIGRKSFALDINVTACWVEIRQFWFQHQSFFLFDQTKKVFTDRVTLAEWYGGDGGQMLTGSWVFDYDGDGKKDIVRQVMEHSMTPGEEEPVEHTAASVFLLLWKDGHFIETPVQDTATLIRRYPIRRFW